MAFAARVARTVAVRALPRPAAAGFRHFSTSRMLMQPVYYSEAHEWCNVEGDKATIGITNHAQEELGEVVYVDLPEVGDSFEAGDTYGTVESVKATSELIMPCAGKVTEVNSALENNTGLVNESPEDKAWMIKVDSIKVPTDLKNKEEYEAHIAANKSD